MQKQKSNKQLTFSRETVRTLSDDELGAVAGGRTEYPTGSVGCPATSGRPYCDCDLTEKTQKY